MDARGEGRLDIRGPEGGAEGKEKDSGGGVRKDGARGNCDVLSTIA